MSMETISPAPESEPSFDYVILNEKERQKLSHVAQVCMALCMVEKDENSMRGSPSEVSGSIMELTGLEHDEITAVIRKTIDQPIDNLRYFQKEPDEQGIRLAITPAGKELVSEEIDKHIKSSVTELTDSIS